jgi:hypothetical protein
MKANELRIWNFVTIGDGAFKTTIADLQIIEMSENNSYQPIPLTEEWLSKMGFKPVSYDFYKISIGHRITLEVSIKDKRAILYNNAKMDFIDLKFTKYVHQLQNLYFALTGNELTIKQ